MTIAALRTTAAVCMLLMTLSSNPAGQTTPTTHALLIGVGRYPNLASRWQLDGPPNDVALVREFLTSANRFTTVARSNIVELAGWPNDPARRPTWRNIEQAFKRLADPKVTKPGDQVVILMAGHGSQQPAAANDADEPDGMDEIFLPADVGRWDGGQGLVRNAIVDNEIRDWVRAITDRGVFVWILFDSCHSGTMTRGAERARSIPPSELGVPATSTRSRGAAQEGQLLDKPSKSEGLVAFYAAQASETTPEKLLPEDGGTRYHGLFTFYLLEILQQATEPLSYRELAERLYERYRSLPRYGGPTPAFEGTSADRRVLGRDQLADRPPFQITARSETGQWTLNGGRLHGVGPSSILAVMPPAGTRDSQQPVGHVVVRSADATTSVVAPVAHNGMPAPSDSALKPGSRARVVTLAIDTPTLKVAGADPSLASALRDLDKTSAGVAEKSELDAPNLAWLLDRRGEDVVLVHASEPRESSGTRTTSAYVVGPAAASDLAERLGQALQRIARADSLRRLAMTPGVRGSSALNLEISAHAGENGAPLAFGSDGRTLRGGQKVQFHVRNSGQRAVDLTVFFVGSNFGITPIYPVPGRDMDTRLEAGKEVQVYSGEITADTLGDEGLVAIGLPPRVPAVNLAMLAQGGLDTRTAETGRGAMTGLAGLVASALRGTRDLKANQLAVDDAHVMTLFSWTTVR